MHARLELPAILVSQRGPVHEGRTRVGEQGRENTAGRMRGWRRGGYEIGCLLSGKRASVSYVVLLCAKILDISREVKRQVLLSWNLSLGCGNGAPEDYVQPPALSG